MLTKKPKTKLLVDGGDPDETLRVKNLLGFVDGQTTNPSLIAKNLFSIVLESHSNADGFESRVILG